MISEEFVKKVYVTEIKDPSRRGRPLRRLKDRVKDYMSERGATKGESTLTSKERVFGQGEVEALLPWPPPWETFTEGARCQSYRQIDRKGTEMLDMKYLQTLTVVIWFNRERNNIEMCTSWHHLLEKADQGVRKWFGHAELM